MNIGKRLGALALAPLLGCMLVVGGEAQAADGNSTQSGGKAMELEQKWDKTFQKSNKVDHSKVTFKNRYGLLELDLTTQKRIPKRSLVWLQEILKTREV